MSNIIKLLFIAPLLAACAQADAGTPAIDAKAQPRAATAEAGQDLARPQPEAPICGHCSADFGLATVSDDDELSMIINSEYVGNIDDVVLVVYTSSDKYTLSFDQWVLDDLNDPSTYETIVMLDIPDAQRLLLVFTVDSVNHYEPVTIDG